MRPMTSREALEIDREDPLCDDGTQARRILDALVAWREAESIYRGSRYSDENFDRMAAAECKLASLERGEEPQA